MHEKPSPLTAEKVGAKFKAPELDRAVIELGRQEKIGAGYENRTRVEANDKTQADVIAVAAQVLPEFDKKEHLENMMAEVSKLSDDRKKRVPLMTELPIIFKKITAPGYESDKKAA